MKRLLVCLALAPAGAAHADHVVTRPEAIEVDRDAPPPGRVELGFDGGAPVGALALGMQVGYVDEPIELSSGSVVRYPVRHRETLALGAAVAFTDFLEVDARVPLAHQVGDRLQGLGDNEALARYVLGDVALGARLRVAGNTRRALFLRGQLWLPTGDDFQFAGDARWSGAWSLIGRITVVPGVVVAATAGIRLRAAEVEVGNRLVGDEADYAIGAVVDVPPFAHLWCKPDQLRATAELDGVAGDKVGAMHGPSPVEARIGLVAAPRPGLDVGVRAGVGLDDQIGSPRFRAMLELAWHTPPPPPRAHPVHLEGDDEDLDSE